MFVHPENCESWIQNLYSLVMPSYVHIVDFKLAAADEVLHPSEVVTLVHKVLPFKCDRKARKFIVSTIAQYYKTGEWTVWNPDQQTWCVDSIISNARLTITLSEVRVIT